MDAKKWTARQHEQHAQLFRHRAAENGRSLAVASSSGVTQIIDPRGHVRARLPNMTEEVLTGFLTPQSHLTFFQLAGWLFGPVSLALSVVLVLFTFRSSGRQLSSDKPGT